MRRLLLLLLLCTLPLRAQVNPTWTTTRPPFRIADNLFYVGSLDLAAFLITTPAGNILLNANYTSSPPQIRRSIEQLGFRWQDTKILLNSQAHADHVGGAAQVVRETGAQNMVMAGDEDVLRSGGRTDFAFGPTPQFPPVRVDRVLHDGDTVNLGDPRHGGVVLTAHKTAGHTRGCTTWTLRVHLPGEPAAQLRDVVIVGGFDPLSSYHLVGPANRKGAYPGIADDFRHTYATLHALPCDLFLGAHGQYFDMNAKLARLPQQGPAVWLDPDGYQAAVAEHEKAFEATLGRQKSVIPRPHWAALRLHPVAPPLPLLLFLLLPFLLSSPKGTCCCSCLSCCHPRSGPAVAVAFLVVIPAGDLLLLLPFLLSSPQGTCSPSRARGAAHASATIESRA